MYRIASLLVGALLLSGCGSGLGREPSATSRITPAMRAACRVQPDSEIATGITIFETMREEGGTKWEALVVASDICWPDNACFVCITAIIDAVYAE